MVKETIGLWVFLEPIYNELFIWLCHFSFMCSTTGANQQRKDLEEAEEKVVAVKQAEFEEIPALKFPENYTRMEEKQIGNSDDFQDYDDYDDFEVKDSEEVSQEVFSSSLYAAITLT